MKVISSSPYAPFNSKEWNSLISKNAKFENTPIKIQKRLKIQGIIKRIAQDKSITLEERIFVEKFAHHNSTISLWLKKANSFRRNGIKNDGGIDNLLQSFGIDGLNKENHFNPNEDDISDWFGGAPGWLRRS